ncbi:TPA: hypothetical protein ACH3X2_009149 [Trebouxia sp. C0005]
MVVEGLVVGDWVGAALEGLVVEGVEGAVGFLEVEVAAQAVVVVLLVVVMVVVVVMMMGEMVVGMRVGMVVVMVVASSPPKLQEEEMGFLVVGVTQVVVD